VGFQDCHGVALQFDRLLHFALHKNLPPSL
jgi:elongation factor P--beta-lysine ligase